MREDERGRAAECGGGGFAVAEKAGDDGCGQPDGAGADGAVRAAFSMEPEEFKEMVDHIRMIEKAVGKVTYDLTPKQKKSREHSRSLFVAQDMKAGDVFTPENLRSVRPSCGLHTRYYEELLGKRITRDARLGTPMDWSLVDFTEKEQQ